MAADELGNDVSAVGVPVTGHIGFAPDGTVGPTPAAGASRSFVLDPDYKVPGLLTEDGGFEWTLEPDGDPIVFWQDGYSLPTGIATAELVLKLAQTDEIVRSITRGKTADENGYMTVDAGGHAVQYSVFTEEIFKNGVIRRRWAPKVSIKTVKEDKNERGNVLGYEVTLTIHRSPLVNNEHFGEWLIPALASVTAASITAVKGTPDPAGTGELVTITGTGFATTTAVTIGGTAVSDFDVVSNTELTAVLPAGAAGAANVVVTNSVGASAAFPYTRDS
ncbi:IPT/TIG domain-containing protein [Paenarthrobacter sp. NPDC089714]|uniref:phage tail tube protein n=1 Tax=Paenarthrobacter sp. NPDC089714 TaxID=3364377 RepID=UPI00381EC3F3